MKRVNQFKTNPAMQIVEPKKTRKMTITAAVVTKEPSMKFAVIVALWQSISRRWIAISFLVIGVIFGLTYGWVINPVEWTGMSYTELTPADKGLLIQVASDLHAYNPDSQQVQELRTRWPELDELACFAAKNQVTDNAEKTRLVSLAYKINQKGCEK